MKFDNRIYSVTIDKYEGGYIIIACFPGSAHKYIRASLSGALSLAEKLFNYKPKPRKRKVKK